MPDPLVQTADLRDEDQRRKDRERIARQVDNLNDTPSQLAFHRELLRRVQLRRTNRDDKPMQVELIPNESHLLLAVVGELVIRAEDLEAAQRLLGPEFSPQAVECEELKGQVVRLVSQLDLGQVTESARLLRGAGICASVNSVLPLDYVVKGQGGAEPTELFVQRPLSVLAGTVTVAVVDTGVAMQKRSDGWLTDFGPDEDPLTPYGAPEDPPLLDFGAGHGTFCAGIIQQVAPEANIRVYRAIDSDGIGSEIQVACAVLRAAREGAQVINLSLGSETPDDQPPVAMEVALEILASDYPDVLLVAAAGNSASTRATWPAAFRDVVAVAALTAELRPAKWSNRGFWVNLSTVGEGIVSTYVEGTEDPELDPAGPDTFGPDSWALWSGTSFCAPQVVGAIAVLLARDANLTPRGAYRELVRDHAVRRLPDYGWAVPLLAGT